MRRKSWIRKYQVVLTTLAALSVCVVIWVVSPAAGGHVGTTATAATQPQNSWANLTMPASGAALLVGVIGTQMLRRQRIKSSAA